MNPVTLDDLKAFGKTLNGQRLVTQFRDCGFTLSVTEKGIEYTPDISGHPRKQQWKWIERFLKRFNESRSLHPREDGQRSLHPGDYKNTRNASYILTIIGKCLAAHS